LGKKTRAGLGVCVVAWKREEEEAYLTGAGGEGRRSSPTYGC
jgi:hypothetical protein